jgi:hypothetical protein
MHVMHIMHVMHVMHGVHSTLVMHGVNSTHAARYWHRVYSTECTAPNTYVDLNADNTAYHAHNIIRYPNAYRTRCAHTA